MVSKFQQHVLERLTSLRLAMNMKFGQESKLSSAVQIKLDTVKLRFYGFDVKQVHKLIL